MILGQCTNLTIATLLLLNFSGCRETPKDSSQRGGSALQASVNPSMALVSNQCHGSHDVVKPYQEPGSHLIVKGGSDEHVRAFHNSLSAVPEDIQQLMYLSGVKVEINGNIDIHSFCVGGLFEEELTFVANRQSKVTSCLYEKEQEPGVILLMEADKDVIATSTVRSIGIIISQYLSKMVIAEDGTISIAENEILRTALRSLAVKFLDDIDSSKSFDMGEYKGLIAEELLTSTKQRTHCDFPKDSQHEVFANYVFSDFLHNQYCGSSGRIEESDFKKSRDYFNNDVMAAISALMSEKSDIQPSYAQCENEENTLSLRRGNNGSGRGFLRSILDNLGQRGSANKANQGAVAIFGGGNNIFGNFFGSFRSNDASSSRPKVAIGNSNSRIRIITPDSNSRSSGGNSGKSTWRDDDDDDDDDDDWEPTPRKAPSTENKKTEQVKKESPSMGQGRSSDMGAPSSRSGGGLDRSAKSARVGRSSGAMGKPNSSGNKAFEDFVRNYDGKKN